MPEPLSHLGRSIAWHSIFGVAAVVAATAGLVVWSMNTEVAGAVVTVGAVAIDGGAKRVQHPEGGVVTAILAHDEDRVLAGAELLTLDDTNIRASFDLVLAQQRYAKAREVGLDAALNARETIDLPIDLPPGLAGIEFDALLEAQNDLIRAETASLTGQKQRLSEQIGQLRQKIVGLEAQLTAEQTQIELIATELADQRRLLADQLVGIARVNELRRAEAQTHGEAGRITAAIAEARAGITELEAMRAQIDDDRRAALIKELETVRAEQVQLAQQRIALEDKLDRLVVRAPQSGVVHASTVMTVGGVVGSGETLMMIVPALERATVEARVGPLDVDKVHPGQPVIVRFSSLDTRRTPDLPARITSIAPDLTTDARTGVQYYLARLEIARVDLASLPEGTSLVPGMPAEVFIRTGDRTVLAYLVKPLLDQVERAFRED